MTIKVYDHQGNERDLAYLKANYGDFVIQPAADGDGPVYEITALYERRDTNATLIVKVLNEDGSPRPGVEVAFYWPDAQYDENAGPMGGVLPGMVPNRAVEGPTNANGDVGFGMGEGAYYWPDKGEIGPHATWVYGAQTRSDLILGLGMVAATNHDHFDVTITRFEDGGNGNGNGPPPAGKKYLLCIPVQLVEIEE